MTGRLPTGPAGIPETEGANGTIPVETKATEDLRAGAPDRRAKIIPKAQAAAPEKAVNIRARPARTALDQGAADATIPAMKMVTGRIA